MIISTSYSHNKYSHDHIFVWVCAIVCLVYMCNAMHMYTCICACINICVCSRSPDLQHSPQCNSHPRLGSNAFSPMRVACIGFADVLLSVLCLVPCTHTSNFTRVHAHFRVSELFLCIAEYHGCCGVDRQTALCWPIFALQCRGVILWGSK